MKTNFPLLLMAGSLIGAMAVAAEPPRLLLQSGGDAMARATVVHLPNGQYALINRRQLDRPLTLYDTAGQAVEFAPRPELTIPAQGLRGAGEMLLVDRSGELHDVWIQLRDQRGDKNEGPRIGINYFIDIWHARTSGDRRSWTAARPVWRGYTGAIMEWRQLGSGRLLIPFGSWVPGAAVAPPTGSHYVTAIYSDDLGQSWQEIGSRLTSPCYEGYNGNNYGACEPVVEELADGRVWMLMRSQTGFLYESISHDQGLTWQAARASRFNASHGPPALFRDPRGRLVVCWNHCELPPRHQGAGVYGGRDALHLAMSDDEGQTWFGFREIYRDAARNESPPKAGDRGTAYPRGAFDAEGRLVVISGQGAGRRNLVLVDPDWLAETSAQTDFSDGLQQWHVFKPVGRPQRWWRDRVAGCQLVPHPLRPGARCLQLGKPDNHDPDGATWNFPNGWSGVATVRLWVNAGCRGGVISLADRMYDPTDSQGERLAVFQAVLSEQPALAGHPLDVGRFHDIVLRWDLSRETCRLEVNGQPAGDLPLRHPTLNGLSYIRFRSTADEIDTAGFVVASVQVKIDQHRTPACTPAEQAAAELRYLKEVISTWKDAWPAGVKPAPGDDKSTPATVGGKPLG